MGSLQIGYFLLLQSDLVLITDNYKIYQSHVIRSLTSSEDVQSKYR